MKATIKGHVLEKFTKLRGNETKSYIRLYQQGEKENLDVQVSGKTFASIEVGKMIELKDVNIGPYAFNDKVGMYAKEEF